MAIDDPGPDPLPWQRTPHEDHGLVHPPGQTLSARHQPLHLQRQLVARLGPPGRLVARLGPRVGSSLASAEPGSG